MDVDTPAGGVAESKTSEGKEEEDKAGEHKEEKEDGGGATTTTAETKKPAEPEPTSFTLGNPARVTPAQEALVSFQADQRYVPVRRQVKPTGIIMLLDTRPGEPEDVAAVESPPLEGDEDEAEPPEPFEWTAPN